MSHAVTLGVPGCRLADMCEVPVEASTRLPAGGVASKEERMATPRGPVDPPLHRVLDKALASHDRDAFGGLREPGMAMVPVDERPVPWAIVNLFNRSGGLDYPMAAQHAARLTQDALHHHANVVAAASDTGGADERHHRFGGADPPLPREDSS
ncbi:hypothetical protein [Oleiagrimonas sp. C23AA]|uniref:hypothetical protein n=1 Tax=Oleiagrimonas sp. C23AA TaxID=2719047 RepID=UPI00141E882D|nr:hypothetical protein [Oleiagrimonas sp. C23AA]NII10782.1 hypothetical protein [Oleiagrimonas sp. C23AA]